MPPDSPGTGTGGGAGGGVAGRSGSPEPLSRLGASFAPGTLCEASGWCWYDPLPSGNSWEAVAGAGRTDLWIAGSAPNALHFDGGRWSLVPSPITVGSIWGASENDVWFGGFRSSVDDSATIAHWDGVALTINATFGISTISEVWGSGASDVYAVGSETLQHWDGAGWSTVPGVTGFHVSGSGPSDVWVVASDGLFHFDGASWARVPEFEGRFITALSVAAPNDVWVVTTLAGNERVEQFDGTSWTAKLDLVGNFINVSDIHASSGQGVWLVGSEFIDFRSVGFEAHFDGTGWFRGPDAPTSLFRVNGAPGLGTIAVGGDGGIVRLVADPSPRFIDLRSGPAVRLNGTFGTAPTDMWAVGDDGNVLHYDGRTVVSVPAGTTADLTDVWGTAPDDVWAVGLGGTLLHFDGNAFAPVPSGTSVDLHAVFSARRDDVWIGGDAGTLLHWDGSSVSPVPLSGVDPRMPVRDLHGLAADDIWLSGGRTVVEGTGSFTQGFVSHFDGTAWSPVETLIFSSPFTSTEPVVRVWALAANDVWAATDRTLSGGRTGYWHFDGTAWTGTFMLDSPATFMFPAISGGSFVFGPHDRWIVGSAGLWQRNTN